MMQLGLSLSLAVARTAGRPAWAPAEAAFAGDLLTGRYWRTARPGCVRASDGYAQTVGGALVKFSANQLRLTDKGLLVPEPMAVNRLPIHNATFPDTSNLTPANSGVITIINVADTPAPV